MPIITTSDLHRLMPDGWCCDRPDCRYGCHEPSVDDMAGAFDGGPDSVEWLREQRDTDDELDANHD